MDSFIHRMENSKGFKYIIFGVRALMENYVEVAHTKGKKITVKDSLGVERDSIINDRRSLFDLGPINTFLSNNYVDGVRLRLAGRTMAALNPHFFWDGYGAYGLKSNKPCIRTGSLAGTSAIVLKYPDNQCWILITNTSTWKGHGFSNDTMAFFEKLRKKYMANMPKKELFICPSRYSAPRLPAGSGCRFSGFPYKKSPFWP